MLPITLRRLLKNMNYTKIEIFKEKLKRDLKPQRYQHTLYTTLKAMELSVGTNADKEKVLIASLLHDCAKYMQPDEEQKKIVEDFLLCEPIIHGPLGAVVAQKEYGVTDEIILNAIKYHSTGRPYMTDEEIIVCLADAIEDSRDYPNLENIKNATKKSLKYGLFVYLQGVVEYEQSKGNKIHHLTLETIEWLKEIL